MTYSPGDTPFLFIFNPLSGFMLTREVCSRFDNDGFVQRVRGFLIGNVLDFRFQINTSLTKVFPFLFYENEKKVLNYIERMISFSSTSLRRLIRA